MTGMWMTEFNKAITMTLDVRPVLRTCLAGMGINQTYRDMRLPKPTVFNPLVIASDPALMRLP